MAKNKRRGGRGGGRGGGRNQRNDDYRTDLLDKASMQNERFFLYYKTQEIVPVEEWDSFVDSLRQHLPTTFRVAGSRRTALTLNGIIKDTHVPTLTNVTFEDQQIPPPVQIPWYPAGLAWQFNVPKKVLRKSPEFRSFHSFLVGETDVGNISRQEAVSMIPPLVLDVQPHHRVIDMCAAPGSKTAQLLEALHDADAEMPEGLLVANDSDYKRTHLLIHQSARLPSPALLVTNMDASNYPAIRLDGKKLLFDRVLCDVPCSGDGTIRKNLGIWKTWQPGDGNGFTRRAMHLLAPGGRIVYSTCSLNPVENEAVVAAALNSNSDFHLIPTDGLLPGLIRRPGMTHWKPTNSLPFPFEFYDTYQDFITAEPSTTSKLTRGHWPPDNVDELNLPRCMRIYPHLQDTGGFFVAVLERNPDAVVNKKKRVASPSAESEAKKPRLDEPSSVDPAKMEEDTAPLLESTEPATTVSEPSPDVTEATDALPEKELKPDISFKENPYTFLKPDDPILLTCVQHLALSPKFPLDSILVRNPDGSAVRSMYITTPLVRQLITSNDYTRIRLASAGTKVFAKQEGAASKGEAAQFRVLAEGLPALMPFIPPENVISADLAVLRTLVTSYYPLCVTFEEPFRSDIGEKGPGSHIVKFSLTNDTLHLPIWKSNVSVSLMIDKKAKSALSLRIFGEDITTAGREKSAAAAVKQETKDKDDQVAGGDEASNPDESATVKEEEEVAAKVEVDDALKVEVDDAVKVEVDEAVKMEVDDTVKVEVGDAVKVEADI
ncbi:S-adenosyl-L-methionine-dependent methyltransferase [Hymenopellis radicata]|nr:S-adenosyl-L-methionine-dependent methyltransferase [Hymenopellis radicata]